MPVFEYKCDKGHRVEIEMPRLLASDPVGDTCRHWTTTRPWPYGVITGDEFNSEAYCEGSLKRDYSGVQFAPVMQSHLNPSTGTVISDPKQFAQELARKSELATERTGIPHNYQPCSLTDPHVAPGSEEG